MAEQDEKGTQDEAPLVRAGEVYESMAPEDDGLGGGRRRVRVESVDEDGTVHARNPVTGVVSRIDAGNMVPPKWSRAYP